MNLKAVVAAVALVVAGPAAQAGLVNTFTAVGTTTANGLVEQGKWEAALVNGSKRQDDLEHFFPDEAPTPGFPLMMKFAGTPPDMGAKLTGSNAITDNSLATGGRHAFGNVGNYWESGVDFSIEFDSAVAAFGFWGSDIGDFGNDTSPTAHSGAVLRVVLTYDDANKTTKPFDIAGSPDNGSDLFWGFTDSTGAKVKSITFTNLTGSIDGQGFDQFMIGDVAVDNTCTTGCTVPEPGSVLLAGLALLGAAGIRRKR